MVYGSHSIKQSGLHDKLITILKDQAIECFELSDVKPNPDITLVYKGIDLCIYNKVDFILAVSGGSVIETAKAITLGASYNGDVWDFFKRKDS